MSQMPPPMGNPPPAGYQPPGSNQSVGLAVASMVLGILSIILFCLWFVSIPLGIVAVILGFIAKGKADRGEAGGKGLALTGMICGAIGLLIAIGILLFALIFGKQVAGWQQKQMQQLQQMQQQQVDQQKNGVATPTPATRPASE